MEFYDEDPLPYLKRIFSQLKKHGVSKADLAKNMKLKPETLTNWAVGRKHISEQDWQALLAEARKIVPDIMDRIAAVDSMRERLKDVPTEELLKELKFRGLEVIVKII